MPTVTGVSGEPVRLVHRGRLVAAVSSVSLEDYGEEALRRNLEDLQWLDAQARSHHRVISSLMDGGPVLPMRLAILYDNDERVEEMLAETQNEFEAALTAVSGRSEWGVKVFLSDYGDPNSDSGRTSDPAVEGKKAGTAYLERKRAGLKARDEARNSHATTAQRVYDLARPFAVAGRRHALQDAQLRGESREMLLNAAFLVDDERCDEFAAAIDELDRTSSGIDVELTGPWPPYSFAFTGVSP